MASRHRFGTNVRNSIDAENFRKAARSVGADLRYWCSMGTVGKVDTESGEFDPTDKHTIYNASDGIDVDVRLEPLNIPVTCRYAGIQAGDVTILAPIRPGDIVKCDFPDGDLTGGIITNIIHSRSNRQPTDSGKPIFGNDRLLIYAKSVPIDIRLAGAAGATPVQVLLEQDGTVTVTADKIKLGGSAAVDALELGTTRQTEETTYIEALQAAVATLQAASSTGPLAALQPGWVEMQAAFAAFLAAMPGFLSKVSFTE